MRKIRAMLLALIIGCAGTSAFAQGLPVLDVANLMQSIESVYQYYQQIQNTIEQVQNTYKQIEQAAQQMASMNWDDLKSLGDNFSGMGENPFEVISGVRNSAQDITKAVNKNMNRIYDLQDSLNKQSISFGGMNVSLADLCGAGEPDKNIFGFVKNAWEYSTDTENGAFSDAIKGWEGKLDYKQRQAIMRKYGMSPRNYATLEYGNYQLSKLIAESNLQATEEGQKQLLEQIENDANAINTMAKNAPDGSVYAQTQLLNSSLAQLDRNLGNFHNSMNKGFGLIGSWFKSEKMKEAVEQQESYTRETAIEETMTSSAFGNEDD